MTRPEIYFGQLTNTDVYVKTRQKEFNYPQGETNNLTSYEGTGGIVLGGFFRRTAHRPRSRRHHEAAVQRRHQPGQPAADAPQHPRSHRGAGAASSPSIPIRTSSSATTAACRGSRTGSRRPTRFRTRATSCSAASASTTFATASRWSSTPTTARRRSTCSTPSDPIIAAYRAIFPTLFKDASAMPRGAPQPRALSRNCC